MNRRSFMKTSAMGIGTCAIASPAISQSAPEIKWRLTSSFPKSVDAVFAGAETFAHSVAEATDGKWQIQVFAPGEIVGALQAADAVGAGTVEMTHTCSYYYVGKDPTFAIGTCLPFGLNPRQTNAWLYQGGGNELLNEFYSRFGLYGLVGGATGTQMGGWFRKEVPTLADIRGLKFRIPGIAGQVLAKIGAVPQQIAGGDIYAALERGTIDAAEWVGPYDDEKLGFTRVAPYYYYPGFWEGGPAVHFFINLEKWNELPPRYKGIAQAAASHATIEMQAKYDARNPAALRRLVAAGTKLRPFSTDILDAAYRAAHELYREVSERNADFKKIYENYRSFRDEEFLWWQVAEATFDSYMIRSRGRS